MNMLKDIKDGCWRCLKTEKYIYEGIYLVFALILSISIALLNNELLKKYSDDDFLNIILYKNGLPVLIFIITVIAMWIGGYLIVRRFKLLSQSQGDDLSYSIIVALFSMILLVFIIVLLFMLINNPILRAIMACSLAVVTLNAFANS